MKTCDKCIQIKDLTEFHKNSTKSDGLSKSCKPCANQRRKDWYLVNKDHAKEYSLLKHYSIDLNTYNAMFEAQNGCCAICGVHQSEVKKSLAVDHCHSTGKVRGLLCKGCNRGLGYFNDTIEKLTKAIQYLVKAGDQ